MTDKQTESSFSEQLQAIDLAPIRDVRQILEEIGSRYRSSISRGYGAEEALYKRTLSFSRELELLMELMEFARKKMPTPDHQPLAQEWKDSGRGEFDIHNPSRIPALFTRLAELPGDFEHRPYVNISAFDYGTLQRLKQSIAAVTTWLHEEGLFTPYFCRQLAAFTGEGVEETQAKARFQDFAGKLTAGAVVDTARGSSIFLGPEVYATEVPGELTRRLRTVRDADFTPRMKASADSGTWIAEWERSHTPLLTTITVALRFAEREGPDLGNDMGERFLRRAAKWQQHWLDRQNAKKPLPGNDTRVSKFPKLKGKTQWGLEGLIPLSVADEAKAAADRMARLPELLHRASFAAPGEGDKDLLEIGKAIKNASAVCERVQLELQDGNPRSIALRQLMAEIRLQIEHHLANDKLKPLIQHIRRHASQGHTDFAPLESAPVATIADETAAEILEEHGVHAAEPQGESARERWRRQLAAAAANSETNERT